MFGICWSLLTVPGIVTPCFSEVLINGTRTDVILEDESNSSENSTKVTVTSGTSIAGNSECYGILGKTPEWNVTVEAGATINAEGASSRAIWLSSDKTTASDLSGNVTNGGVLKGVTAVEMGSGTVVNEKGATMSGANIGVAIVNGESTVINESGISGGNYGVYMRGTDNTVTNKEGAAITGTSLAGISIENGTVRNEKYASVTGAKGIHFRGSGNDTLDNAGVINGTGGYAVLMGAGDDSVYLRDGSTITGNVDGDNSTDATVLSGTADKVFLEGSGQIMGGTLLNFETITKSGDGTWKLGGDLALSNGSSVSLLGGTLEVSGAFTLKTGATQTLGVGTDGKIAKTVADTAVLNGNSLTVVTKGIKGGKHTIIETTNGLSGAYGSITSDLKSRYRELSLSYDSKNSYVNVMSNFRKAAHTSNQSAVASSIDDKYGNGAGSGDIVTVVDELDSMGDTSVASALDQMSGTSHTVSATVAPARQGSFYRSLFSRTGGIAGSGFLGLNDRESNPLTMLASGGPVTSDAGFSLERDAQKLPYGAWIKGYGVTGSRHGNDGGSRYDYTIGGAIAGFDYLVDPSIRVGVAIGYSKTNVDMKESQDNSDADSMQGAIYGSYVPAGKMWYIDVAFAYSKNSYETKRYIDFGNIHRVAKGSYDGNDISGYLEGGYKVAWKDYTLTPLISVLAMRNHTDSFTETGAGTLNLTTASQNTDSLQSGLGVKMSRNFETAKDFFLTPELGVKWLHEFGDTEANINARFADSPAGSFVISSDTVERDAGVFSLNLTGRKADRLNFFLSYDLALTKDQVSHAFTGGFRFNW